MARIDGVDPKRGGVMVRLTYWAAKRKVGMLPETITIYAHNPWVLRGYGAYEMAAERASRVDKKLKALASVKAGSMVGCAW
jgi:hypothetical protein